MQHSGPTSARPYLLAWKLEGRTVVVVGGGAIGTAKVETLLETGARLVVVDPTPSSRVRDLAARGIVRLRRRRYRPTDFVRAALVVAATGDARVNRRIGQAARAFGAVVNAVDDPANCDVTVPAVIHRGPATIAISTAGGTPAGARFLREQLTALVDSEIDVGVGHVLHEAVNARHASRVSGRYRYDYSRWRTEFFEPGVARLRQGGDPSALARLRNQFVERFGDHDSQIASPRRVGSVTLVGAGPGGVDLVTVRGARALARADVVVYDRLADPELLLSAPPAAERIPVGKGKGSGTSQAEINALLVNRALAGNHVVRLKGGDSFVFGRGGEEIEALAEAGVPVEVVPGVSSVTAAPALAGVCLTDRRLASSFTVVSGHRLGRVELPPASTTDTLVVLMGASNAAEIARSLQAAGWSGDQPVLFAHAAGTSDQCSTIANLGRHGPRRQSVSCADRHRPRSNRAAFGDATFARFAGVSTRSVTIFHPEAVHTAGVRLVTRALCLLALGLVLAACRVDATVDVDVTEDGSGTVTLTTVFDAEATEALGGSDGLGDEIFLRDLVAADWTLARPEVGLDGSTTIVAAKSVASASGFQAVLDEIAGPGVFGNFVVTTRDEFAAHRQSLAFDVDLGQGWALFSDDGVADAFGGEPFGVPIEELTEGRSIDDIVGVTVTASVAGAEGGTPSTTSAVPRFDGEPVSLRIAAAVEESTAVLLRWIAYALASLCALAFVLAITGLWLQRRADRLRPAPTPAPLRTRVPGHAVEPTGGGRTGSRADGRGSRRGDEPQGPIRLVVVEPLTVLYQQSEAPEHYLLPFVRHNGGDARADDLLDAYQDLLRGRMTTDAFWAGCGVTGATEDVDRVFLEMRWLRKEAKSLLKELERRRIPVAAVTNDAREWSTTARDRDRLTAIWPWIVSGEAGALKPDTGMFERLRRETGTAYRHCLYLDTRVESLDAARELGMRTALYNADKLHLPEVVGHPVVADLTSLVRRTLGSR
ncbi:MAG: uroporphyrinogen-III C-methyltransferase [Actinomycetota bacterium]